MSGRVVHFEIPFDEGDRARAFYQNVFGWSIVPMPEMDYTLVSTGPTTEQGPPSEPGFINGGLMQRTDGFHGPVIVVDVEDIDAALAKVEELEAKAARDGGSDPDRPDSTGPEDGPSEGPAVG